MPRKAKPLQLGDDGHYFECHPLNATHIRLNIPGPLPDRVIPVITSGPRAGTTCWTWNGNIYKPTLRPSVLSRVEFQGEKEDIVCHSFITDGQVQFLVDCTHFLAGQTISLLDVDVDVD